MKKNLIIALITLFGTSVGCVSNNVETNKTIKAEKNSDITNKLQNITYVNPNETVEIKKTKSFKIVLSSNPTTGYSWQPKTFNTNIIVLETNYFIPPSFQDNQPPRLGEGGVELWQFKAIGDGEDTIHMIYHRKWETNVPPIREEIFKIRIVP